MTHILERIADGTAWRPRQREVRLRAEVVEETLPIVTTALVCERVLIEKDEVISAIRVFDRLFYEMPTVPTPPDFRAGIAFTLLVILKRGNARGSSYDLDVVIRSPSGKEGRPSVEGTPLRLEIPGDDPDSGANVQVGVVMTPSEDGLHWIEVNINSRLSARVPLRLIRRDPTLR